MQLKQWLAIKFHGIATQYFQDYLGFAKKVFSSLKSA